MRKEIITGNGQTYELPPLELAEITKIGNDLLMKWPDGEMLLKGFYKSRGVKFITGGREIDAIEMLEALGRDDLKPAEGDDVKKETHNSRHEDESVSADEGIEKLDGVESGDFAPDRDENAILRANFGEAENSESLSGVFSETDESYGSGQQLPSHGDHGADDRDPLNSGDSGGADNREDSEYPGNFGENTGNGNNNGEDGDPDKGDSDNRDPVKGDDEKDPNKGDGENKNPNKGDDDNKDSNKGDDNKDPVKGDGDNPDKGDDNKDPNKGDDENKDPDKGDDNKDPNKGDDEKDPNKGDDNKDPDKGDDNKDPVKGDDNNDPNKGDDEKDPNKGDDNKDPDKGDDEKDPNKGDDDNKDPNKGDDDNKDPNKGDDENKDPDKGDDDNKDPNKGDDENKDPDKGDDNNDPNKGDDDNKDPNKGDDEKDPNKGDDEKDPDKGDGDDGEPDVPTLENASFALDEANLAQGTNPDAGALVKSGSIAVSSESGLKSLTVDGMDIHLDGTPTEMRTADGVLSLSYASGFLNWSYTLERAVSNPDGSSHIFAVYAESVKGGVAESALSLQIADDAPLASGFSRAMGEDDAVSGNVFDHDRAGADGARVEWQKDAPFYGKAVLDSDGSWSYEINHDNETVAGLEPGETVTETIRYEIVDADGDRSMASLSFEITGREKTDPPVTPDPPAPPEPEPMLEVGSPDAIFVSEANLSVGTNPDAGQLVKSATLRIDSSHEIDTVTVGGKTVGASSLPAEIRLDQGLLSLSLADGALSCSFKLDAASAETILSIPLVIRNSAGLSRETELVINIADDAPAAESFSVSVNADGGSVPGDVTDGVKMGADGFDRVEWGNTESRFGSLSVNVDGTWIFTVNPESDYVRAIPEGESASESFRYVIHDRDGSASEGTLRVTVNGVKQPEPPHDVFITAENPDTLNFSEASLPDGTDSDPDALTRGGQISVTASAPVSAISVDGETVYLDGRKKTLDADGGKLVLKWDADGNGGILFYEFTLGSAPKNGQPSFNILLQTADGGSRLLPLRVSVADDAPVALNAESSIDEGIASVSGDIIRDSGSKTGADGLGRVEWLNMDAKYGEFVDLGNGRWEYRLDSSHPDIFGMNDGQSRTETFRYIVYDGDESASETRELVITINGVTNGVTLSSAEIRLSEGSLENGTNPNPDLLSCSGDIPVDAPAGVASIQVAGKKVQLDGSETSVPLPEGTLLVSWNGTGIHYEFSLTKAAANEPRELEVRVTDRTGMSQTTTLLVDIADDAPNPLDLSENATEGQSDALRGDVSGMAGADGLKSVTWDGEALYGKFVHKSNGEWIYELDNNNRSVRELPEGGSLQERFTYTITDRDGQSKSAVLTINISGVNNGIEISGMPDLSFDEASLPGGTAPKPSALVKTGDILIDAPDGLTSIKINGATIPLNGDTVSVTSGQAELTLSYQNGKLHYACELIEGGSSSPSFTLEIRDPDSVRTETLNIGITDDAPQALNDTAQVSVADPAISGDALLNDRLGADGLGRLEWVSLDGNFGTLSQGKDGNWTYVLDTDNADVKKMGSSDRLFDTFRYVIHDSDGSVSNEATLTISISGRNHDVAISGGGDLAFSEGNLPGGLDEKPSALVKTGFFQIDAPDGVAEILVNNQYPIYLDGREFPFSSDIGILKMSYDRASGQLRYSYELTDKLPAAGNASISMTIRVTDKDGDYDDSSFRITVSDDGIRAEPAAGSITEGDAEATGTVAGSVSAGIDGLKEVQWLSLDGAHGTLSGNADGTWSYVLNADDEEVMRLTTDGAKLTDTFEYRAVDGDGTVSEKSRLVITISGANRGITLSSATNLSVSEENLEKGQNPDYLMREASGSIEVGIPDTIRDLSVRYGDEWHTVSTSGGNTAIRTAEGDCVFSWRATGPGHGFIDYSYTLKNAGSTPRHDFTVRVTDWDGSEATQTLHVDIADSVSRANPDSGAVSMSKPGASGNALDNDHIGPDGIGSVSWDGTKGAHGTLKTGENGEWEYILNSGDMEIVNLPAGETRQEVFWYTIREADGQESRASLTITITGQGTAQETTSGIEIADSFGMSGMAIIYLLAADSDGNLPSGIDIYDGNTKVGAAVWNDQVNYFMATVFFDGNIHDLHFEADMDGERVSSGIVRVGSETGESLSSGGAEIVLAADGNDVVSYRQDAVKLDGGDGIDVIVAGSGLRMNDLDNIENFEIFLSGNGIDLSGIEDLVKYGVTLKIDERRIYLSSEWTAGDSFNDYILIRGGETIRLESSLGVTTEEPEMRLAATVICGDDSVIDQQENMSMTVTISGTVTVVNARMPNIVEFWHNGTKLGEAEVQPDGSWTNSLIAAKNFTGMSEVEVRAAFVSLSGTVIGEKVVMPYYHNKSDGNYMRDDILADGVSYKSYDGDYKENSKADPDHVIINSNSTHIYLDGEVGTGVQGADDYIEIRGNFSSYIYGEGTGIGGRAGNDTIVITGDYNSEIFGDGDLQYGGVGGDDRITVFGSHNRHIYGDGNMADSSDNGTMIAGNDEIVIRGDENWGVYGDGTINGIAGSDIIRVYGNRNHDIYGEGENINAGRTESDEIYVYGSGNYRIFGDGSLNLSSTATYSGDMIVVDGSSNHDIYGDSEKIGNGVGGNDRLYVNGDSNRNINGDGYVFMGGRGGDDYMEINGSRNSGIYGDGYMLYGQAGNDEIVINGNYNSAVYGDTGETVTGAMAGHDIIRINGSGNSNIHGDYNLDENYGGIGGGNDRIYISGSGNSNIHGDGGDDYIENTGSGNSNIHGDEGNDIFLSARLDPVYGDSGFDILLTGAYEPYGGADASDLIAHGLEYVICTMDGGVATDIDISGADALRANMGIWAGGFDGRWTAYHYEMIVEPVYGYDSETGLSYIDHYNYIDPYEGLDPYEAWIGGHHFKLLVLEGASGRASALSASAVAEESPETLDDYVGQSGTQSARTASVQLEAASVSIEPMNGSEELMLMTAQNEVENNS